MSPSQEIIHLCPDGGESITQCCDKTPFELPKTDRITADRSKVTCGKSQEAEKAAREILANSDEHGPTLEELTAALTSFSEAETKRWKDLYHLADNIVDRIAKLTKRNQNEETVVGAVERIINTSYETIKELGLRHEKAIEAAVKEENERCAKVAESFVGGFLVGDSDSDNKAKEIASAVRSRERKV